ncbi:hypothetical protein K469DRAFT_702872 [Zopfia rhizophila CBS 207.26]|uniref:Uncharacterized protein n=1 Tax=Zopfia rhizophila CBS 207.26 TaxID=1314779 RepID=A0A6A6D6T4_9PEZI|nr:hypothetical protein K469DRAFT_702872 [Zopfia rhizophila CBS 207.26]
MSPAIASRLKRRGGFIVTRVCTASWTIGQHDPFSPAAPYASQTIGLEGSAHVSQYTQRR